MCNEFRAQKIQYYWIDTRCRECAHYEKKSEEFFAKRSDGPNGNIRKENSTYFLLNSFWQIEHMNVFAGSLPISRFSPK